MGLANGVHHLAIATADIKAQIEYFTDVLGMELVALYWMHGVPNTWHGFLKLGDSCSIAFVQNQEIAKIPREIGVTHAGSAAAPVAPGAMQHVALNVDTLDALLALRDRIRSRGVNVFGPLDHGMCHSIYFAGPEDLSLEIATSAQPIDGRAWIDPEVVQLAGISPEELARYRAPAAFASQGGKVPQPPIDPTRPHARGFPKPLYEALLAMSDEEVTAQLSESTPPVRVDD
jgi:catechol 2,3-dioxygenase-like lactoylglutathione lyase family enzyme